MWSADVPRGLTELQQASYAAVSWALPTYLTYSLYNPCSRGKNEAALDIVASFFVFFTSSRVSRSLLSIAAWNGSESEHGLMIAVVG